ncbi:ribokinase [Rhodobacter sp. 24-YEA-8]|uniref:ribokinase n=1 Tax=Rhodobacter sp. 24-YEA-8 TaxID=1884310 RepID=UPI0008958FC9|nr:ribokinase [Rhodobacter sp. 24-YEA-8]SEB74471.1 6-phosphofructokinase [Rhodobacter sp. 24-YEA-8]
MSAVKPVVVLGIFNADAVYRASRQPKIGETIMGEDFKLEPGGKGSNQAVAAAKAAGPGGGAHIITRLGRDDFAKMARTVWSDAGVIPEVTEDATSHTGSAFIFIEAATGNNAIIVAAGAGGRITPGDLEARADLIRGAGVFITQLEQPIEAARTGLRLAREAGVTTILNPAPAAELDDALLALCDFLTPNESEAELLTGIPVTDIASAVFAADALLARGVGAVVVTLGANGVLYRDRETQLHIPVVSAGPVVETTGAGDAFNGGFAVALSEGMEIETALRFGNATAGLSVTRAGAASAMAGRDEIDALLAKD